MNQKSIRFLTYVIKGGIFILPFLSLIVSSSLFFPFITGKNFFFRIVVEVLFLLWVFAAVFDKKLRPRRSPILLALAATLFILFLAMVFGQNPYRSFWSNYERMEGFIGHLHLFAYFLILASVFKSKKDFKILFGSMLFVSVIVSFYGLLQHFGKLAIHQGSTRVDATLGNAAYLAMFLVFNMFLTTLFFYWFKHKWLRIGLALLFAFQALIMFLTATRGAILGFLGGLFLFGLLMAIFSKQKRNRLVFGGLVLLVILLVGVFMLVKNTQFVMNNEVLKRFATISFSETTTQSRLTIWGMSWKGFLEHPVLGWGQENYNLVFNKYYQPWLYKQEPWFDRAHNIIFDWLISAGGLGLLSYLSIFAAALYVIWRGYKRKLFSLIEASTAASLLAAYFFNNLFVFDNLTSYFMFFSILAFLQTTGWEDNKKIENKKNNRPRRQAAQTDISGLGYLAVTASFLLVVFSLYVVNVKPILAGKNLINALMLAGKGASVQTVLDKYNQVFSYHTFGTSEAREQLATYATRIASNRQIAKQDRVLVLNRAIDEMEKQVARFPNDARYRVFLGSLYTKAGLFDKAESTFKEAIKLSPKKQRMYFGLADVYLAQRNYDKALEVLKTAYDFDKSYKEAASNLYMAAILKNDQKYLKQLKSDFVTRFGPDFLINQKFANAYFSAGNYEKVKEIWLAFVEKNPNNPQYHLNLAAAYLKLDQRDLSIKEIKKVIELKPSFKKQGEYYINEIKAGRNP